MCVIMSSYAQYEGDGPSLDVSLLGGDFDSDDCIDDALDYFN